MVIKALIYNALVLLINIRAREIFKLSINVLFSVIEEEATTRESLLSDFLERRIFCDYVPKLTLPTRLIALVHNQDLKIAIVILLISSTTRNSQ